MIVLTCVLCWCVIKICYPVILQPFDYDANERNKHKFLVQTVVIDPITDYADDSKVFQVTYMF